MNAYRGSNSDIEQIADSLRNAVIEKLNASDLRGRELLEEIVRITGGTIEAVDDPSEQEARGGSLVIKTDETYRIFLSPYTMPLRDNFTIAHELGHFVLHYYLQKPRPQLPACFTRYGSGQMEWQANRFAAALLMPADQFREQYARVKNDHFLLAGYFGVSKPAVVARIDSLELNRE